jgi:hypothetical protein
MVANRLESVNSYEQNISIFVNMLQNKDLTVLFRYFLLTICCIGATMMSENMSSLIRPCSQQPYRLRMEDRGFLKGIYDKS